MTRAPLFFTVQRNAATKACDCGKRFFWAVLPSGKRMPIDCDVEGGHRPTLERDGYGVSHFSTCPNSDKHRARPSSPVSRPSTGTV